ncbi:MAG: glycosyl hydrolase, partial [Bacteroidetes bacterium 4572_114]
MNKRLLKIAAVVLILFSVILINKFFRKSDNLLPEKRPNDWFYLQRAYPYNEINYTAYRDALAQAAKMKEEYKLHDNRVSWEFAGPVNIGGRVTAVAMHPANMDMFYVGAASGGVFKTEDAGGSWTPVFDDQLSLSIGDIALAPSNPEIIYVGTGEANPGGGSLAYDGLGVFRSDDGGNTWENLGLEESGSIGRLAVHPQNPDICYVAAMGRMFSTNEQRGVFKTTDGGQSWENILYLTDSTGAIDIVIHPENPDILYACTWERTRRPDKRNYGGETCGIYRTNDGGENWEELSNGLPGGPNVGRIGISISQSDPEILYAIYADKTGYFDGVFKTTNNGDTWTQTNDGALSNIYSSYGWWFGRIRVDPTDPDIVYGIGFDLYKTSNGGNSWSNIGWSVHVDQHGLNAHPLNSNFLVLGNDGGVYTSQNGGSSWEHLNNLPITQFYTSEMDYQNPDRLYGGTQDNGTNRTMTGSWDDWSNIYGGDGFYVLVNPQNNQYVYAEYQYGGLGRSTNGGSSFSGGTNGIGSDRFNWMSPLAFNPNNPSTLYFGGSKLYKSTNHAASWSAISPDLTNGPGQYNQTYGTITTIAVSPVNGQIIYAGT